LPAGARKIVIVVPGVVADGIEVEFVFVLPQAVGMIVKRSKVANVVRNLPSDLFHMPFMIFLLVENVWQICLQLLYLSDISM
jgi:hypothetical protein